MYLGYFDITSDFDSEVEVRLSLHVMKPLTCSLTSLRHLSLLLQRWWNTHAGSHPSYVATT